MPTSAISIIFSLIIIEGLLSVDNAMVLATMVSHLPGKQKVWALRAGLLGAYALRTLALVSVSFLTGNCWLKTAGALYLLYLMISHLGVDDNDKESQKPPAMSFWMTVVALEFADMTFSIDNVLTAVSFSSNLCFVTIGVFIGMAVMRFVAGMAVNLMERFPVLSKMAYILVGLVGCQLLIEQFSGVKTGELQKFLNMLAILTAALIYDRSSILKRLLAPTAHKLRMSFSVSTQIIDWILKPVVVPVHFALALVKRMFAVLPLPLH